MSFKNFVEVEDVLENTKVSDKVENLTFWKEGMEAEDLAKLNIKDEGMYVIVDKKPDVKEERMAEENEATENGEIASKLNVKDDTSSKVDEDVFEKLERPSQ